MSKIFRSRLSLEFPSGYLSGSECRKIDDEFDYLGFFVVPQGSTIVAKDFKDRDLEYYKFFFNQISVSDSDKDCQNWWSSEKSRDLLILLNSKETSYRLRQKFNLNLNGDDIAFNSRELRTVVKKYMDKLVLKPFFGFSGIGIKKIEPSDLEKLRIKEKDQYIIEPFLNIISEIGHRVRLRNNRLESQFSLLYSKSDGSYSGTEIMPENKLEKVLCSQYKYSLRYVKKVHYKIFKEISRRYGVNEIQIDSFFFENGNRILFRPLSELNFRHSFGSIAYEVLNKFSHMKYAKLIIRKSPGSEMITLLQKHSIEISDHNSMAICLTPSSDSKRFLVIFLCSIEKNGLDNIESKFLATFIQ